MCIVRHFSIFSVKLFIPLSIFSRVVSLLQVFKIFCILKNIIYIFFSTILWISFHILDDKDIYIKAKTSQTKKNEDKRTKI